MIKYTIQRQRISTLSTVVKAETLEEALKLADQNFYEGEYKEDEDSVLIDPSVYWACDEYRTIYSNEDEKVS